MFQKEIDKLKLDISQYSKETNTSEAIRWLQEQRDVLKSMVHDTEEHLSKVIVSYNQL